MPSALGLATGVIAGLAAVTPASGFVGPFGGLVIGISSGAICFLASTTIKRRFGYDDSLDVFGVHGVGGFVGTLLVAVFAVESLGGNQADLAVGRQLGVQAFAAISVGIYTVVVTYAILKGVEAVLGLRVSEHDEERGLDISLHDEAGYRL
jgi:Amt family ammonium transporter